MKKQLAIKGHKTRGNEIIAILQMLGGKNKGKWQGSSIDIFYFVDEKGFINGLQIWDDKNIEFGIFTLDRFLEKYPYRVGDKVINYNYSGYGIITEMVWDSDDCCMKYYVEFENFGEKVWFKYNEINISDVRCYKDEDDTDPLHELCESKLSTLLVDSEVCEDEVEIVLNDYEIVVKDGKTYAIKKKPKYPTTYEECCNVLKIPKDERYIEIDVPLSYNNPLYKFTELLICRDAYWKIADNWKPDYKNSNIDLYVIINIYNRVEKAKYGYGFQHCVLSFPTEEMRDAFYENFKGLIEKCKNLL